ncbi:MAG: hypothetical protein LBS53_14335 [Synergistaceae bacterium]|nr:hypothetical protein [Synergistaceae bacterium]
MNVLESTLTGATLWRTTRLAAAQATSPMEKVAIGGTIGAIIGATIGVIAVLERDGDI